MQSVLSTRRKTSPRKYRKKWWHFMKKSKVKPTRALDIQHHVNLNHNDDDGVEYYEMDNFRDNNNFSRRYYDENFSFMRRAKLNGTKNYTDPHEDEGVGHESMRDSLESSEISSEAFSSRYQPRNNFNQVTQFIQNNNNKITIIIKHDNNNDGPQQQPEQNITPQIIYIQPASSQPNLHANIASSNNENVYNSLDDLDSDEHYQFYNESAIDVPEDFKGDSYLVLNFNDAANKKLKRRICTPTRNLRPLIDDEDFMLKNKGKKKNNWFGSKEDNVKNILNDDPIKKLASPVVRNTQHKRQAPPKPKRNIQRNLATEKAKTLGSIESGQHYNWNVVFPQTQIHKNSILYRETALNASYRNQLRFMSEKIMTMGGRGHLGFDFGGSTKELSPRKVVKNSSLLYDDKHSKSEISLNQIKNENKSTLLNMIALPFNWKSRMLISRNNEVKKSSAGKSNMLTNFWRRKRVGVGFTCNKRVQDSDGGFFERFGSLLHAREENNEEKLLADPASLVHPEIRQRTKDAMPAENDVTFEARTSGDIDSGNESAETDSDSEEKREENIRKLQNSLVGMNIEELYEEILYEILHNVGNDESKVDTDKMFKFMQEAFRIQEETHNDLFEKAQVKEPPELRLNIEIIEAKDLNPKDPNGLADPFVTLYIASAPATRYTSSVQSATLCPKYEEHFSLPISENPNDDTLIIEVYDFDPAETLGEKMNKFFEVKGAKGFRKLMKEIAQTASSGKHDNEFIGSAKVPLRSIPASGLMMWYNLDKKGKTRSQGTIKARLNFSSEKNDQVAAQEHRHILKILLYHELESSQVAHYWWSGKFNQMAETIITQHAAQSGLTDVDTAFAQWSVYTEVHQQHPLSFELFENIIDVLIEPVQRKIVNCEEDLSLFWEATKRLLPSCFGIVRKLRKKLAGDSNAIKHLTRALNIISKITMLEPPEGFDLFPEQYYGWLKRATDQSTAWDIREAINQAVAIGTEEYFESIIDHNELNSDDNDLRLQQLIKVIQLVRSDLQRAIEHHDKVFQEVLNYQYAGILYKVYDRKVEAVVKPIVVDICSKRIDRLDLLDRPDMKHNRYEEINMLTTLFELYLLLKRFSVLGSALCPTVMDFCMKEYYDWFADGVAHWLDISLYKALTRIQKAIELDSLIAVDATVKYSSSAVDTLAIFYQIRIFWQQLAWPNAEGAFIFVSKIVDDICRCCTFYADTMATRIDNFGMVETVYEKKFQVTPEWCLAINNIDYIRMSIRQFVKELDVDMIISNMSDYRGPQDAERCNATLQNVIENAVDTGGNKILQLIDMLAQKMSPVMRRFLTEGAELFYTDSNSMDRLMMYMEDSLKTLHTELNDDNFMRVLDAIWVEIASILFDLVHSSLEKRRPPSFYSNLRSTLEVMVENFKCQDPNREMHTSDKDALENVQKLLELHGYETSDLIHQYYKERYTMQQKLKDTPFGILTIQSYFQGNKLELEVMNAKHLIPMNSDGSTCDPFVRIHFYPEDKFIGVLQPKTKVHQKTLFPLFDEKFSITLTDDQRKMSEAIILFSVKDHDYFGMANQYVAEAFLMFKDIADITSDSGSIKQLHLTLTRPQNENMEAVKALQYRVGDKLAKDFLKKLKTKKVDAAR